MKKLSQQVFAAAQKAINLFWKGRKYTFQKKYATLY